MPFYYNFPFFMILVPMVAAIAMPLIRNRSIAKTLSIAIQVFLAVISLGLLLSLLGADDASFTYAMGHFPAPFGNELRAGTLEAMMSLCFSLVMLFSLLGGDTDATKDIREEKAHLYYLMLLLITTSLMVLVYTNDMFTAYVFIEINTVAACAIVMSKERKKTIWATVKYLFMSALGSGLFLMSLTILYGLTGHLLMEPIYDAVQVLAANPNDQYYLPLVMTLGLFLIAVAVKCALFPFHTWLPDAHGAATTTSSAVLSGLVLKGYIILLIKLIYRVYGFEVVRGLGILQVMFALGMCAMVFGSIAAFMQKDIKRMIAFSSVAQIGYIFLGIGLGTPSGFAVASYHIIAHAFTKSMLFIASGSLINASGTQTIADMQGVARRDKIAATAFVVGAASMIGVPLFAGFGSKFFFAEAAMNGEYGTWITLVVLVFSTFLNALYYIPVLSAIFSRKKEVAGQLPEKKIAFSKRPLETFSMISLVAFNLLLGTTFGPLLETIREGFTMLG